MSGWAEPPARVLRLWRTMLGDEHAFVPGARVLVHGSTGVCRPGWVGVVRLGDGIAAELGVASDEDIRALRTLDDPSDPDQVATALAPAETVGPGVLSYLLDERGPTEVVVPDGVSLEVEPVSSIRPWLATLPDEDVAESSVAASQEAVVARRFGAPVAAACHLEWPTGIAHLGVLVDPQHRQHGIGVAVARRATDRAHALGLVVQWRAAATNTASRALARRLGLVEVGRQFSFRPG